MQNILSITLKSTIAQLISITGVFFLFGYLLYFLQKRINKNYIKVFGWNSLLLTAWIGTPIHEFGHLLFALIFNYKIKNVNLFTPNKKTGRMGHVKYGYKKGSILHRLGKFFVGSGPLFFGTGVVVILMYYLVPNGVEILTLLNKNINLEFTSQIQEILWSLLTVSNFYNYQFWIFLYLALSIVTHMAPSKRDMSQMWSGFFWFGLILFALNLIALSIFGVELNQYFVSLKYYLAVLTSFFIFAVVLASLHLLITEIILRFYNFFKKYK